jgi:hypothetical protein
VLTLGWIQDLGIRRASVTFIYWFLVLFEAKSLLKMALSTCQTILCVRFYFNSVFLFYQLIKINHLDGGKEYQPRVKGSLLL